jgi:hypothetical protein
VKLRHTAILAIVGYCLIVPPLQASHEQMDTMAPFSQWVIEGHFDTEEACYQGREKMMTLGSANLDKQDSVVDRQRVSAVCINCEDPRLKPK